MRLNKFNLKFVETIFIYTYYADRKEFIQYIRQGERKPRKQQKKKHHKNKRRKNQQQNDELGNHNTCINFVFDRKKESCGL